MNLFQFKNPENLWLIIIIPLIIGLYIFAQYLKNKQIKQLGNKDLVLKLTPDFSKYRIIFKFTVLLFAVFFIIIALARPQSVSKVKTDAGKNREIIIALDVSNSMLAEDIKPNRLGRAKQMISDIFHNNPADRIGLIVFAGDAFVQIPVTSSFASVDVFLSSIDTETVPVQGTNITKAIEMSVAMFDETENSEKLILILTDGENHEQKAIEAAKKAHEKGIIISTVGVGKKFAVPIPDRNTGNYKKDKNNKVVLTKLNNLILTQIANAGGGKYFETGNFFTDIEKIQKQIDGLGKTNGKTEIEEYADLFPYFIFIALILLVLEFIFLERRNHKLSNLSIFK
ncbi:MAG: VWA domain-containing protein [Bacteroidales bacterium]|nr:VWA domain-containing protein [Bacteroidales bacterium]